MAICFAKRSQLLSEIDYLVLNGSFSLLGSYYSIPTYDFYEIAPQ